MSKNLANRHKMTPQQELHAIETLMDVRMDIAERAQAKGIANLKRGDKKPDVPVTNTASVAGETNKYERTAAVQTAREMGKPVRQVQDIARVMRAASGKGRSQHAPIAPS